MMWEVPKKIWAQLEVPLRSYSQNMFIGILLSDVIKCKTESLRASFLDILFDTFKTLKYLWWIHWCFSYDIGDKIQSSILQSRKMVAVASLIDMLPIEGPVLRQCHNTETPTLVSWQCGNTETTLIFIVNFNIFDWNYKENHHFWQKVEHHHFCQNEKSSIFAQILQYCFFEKKWKNHQFWQKFEKSSMVEFFYISGECRKCAKIFDTRFCLVNHH